MGSVLSFRNESGNVLMLGAKPEEGTTLEAFDNKTHKLRFGITVNPINTVAVGGIPAVQKPHLGAANRDAALGAAASHDFGELRLLATVLDSAARNTKPSGDFFVRAMKAAQLFKFNEIHYGLPPASTGAIAAVHHPSLLKEFREAVADWPIGKPRLGISSDSGRSLQSGRSGSKLISSATAK
jgi:hypothetical protein